MASILTRSELLATVAMSGCWSLAGVLALTMPLGRRIRRERLELAWWVDHPEGISGASVAPGIPFSVSIELRHRGGGDLELSSLEPITNEGLEHLELPNLPILIGPASAGKMKIRLCALSAGRHAVHGLALTVRGPLGLFEVPLYFPSPLHLSVLPRAVGRRRRQDRLSAGAQHQTGRSQISRRGSGTDLYELRELLPGDPFRSIAWKASARHGRLMVREVEQHVERAHWLILDVGGTMRGGPPGHRKLDVALEEAARRIEQALGEGERLGLITVDSRILIDIPLGEGTLHRRRLSHALLDATEIVDADLTQPDDDEVVRMVVRFLSLHTGTDFGRDDSRSTGLRSYLRTALAKESPLARPIESETTLGELARRYCRMQGLPLTHRSDAEPGAKDHAFSLALQEIARRSQQPTSISWLTDLDGLAFTEELIASARLVGQHGHALTLATLDGRALAPKPRNDLERTLHVVYGHGEERRIRDARRLFGRVGVRVEPLHGAGPMPKAMLHG